MKKQLLTILGISLLASSALSKPAEYNPKVNNTQLNFEGSFHFQAGALHQKKLEAKDKLVSPGRKQFAFTTDASFNVTFKQELENFKYGVMLVLTPTTQLNTGSACNGSHLFIETDFGKFEAGSPADSGTQMRIGGGDVTAGSGDWSDYAKLDAERLKYNGLAPEFIEFSGYFISSYKADFSQFIDGTERARTINYFTPQFNGFQLGVSYIPDSSNVGTGPFSKKTNVGIKKYKPDVLLDKNNVVVPGGAWVVDTNVRDAVALGLKYEYNISDGMDLAIAATGEIAKASGKAQLVQNEEAKDTDTSNPRKVLEEYKLKNLATYNIGGTLYCGNFAYGLSYGSLNKSLTAPEFNKTGRDTRYYNAAIGYEQGPFKASFEYFRSDQFKNQLDAYTLGTEYKAAPGLSPYAEVTHFNAKGRPSFYPDAPKTKANGNVFIIGAKLRLKL